MELIIMLLVALPLGFFIGDRIYAYGSYIAIHAFAFSFQTLFLILEWANGSEQAFGSYPHFSNGDVWAYGAINLAIYLVGFGLVTLGQYLRTRLGNRRGSVSLDPVS